MAPGSSPARGADHLFFQEFPTYRDEPFPELNRLTRNEYHPALPGPENYYQENILE